MEQERNIHKSIKRENCERERERRADQKKIGSGRGKPCEENKPEEGKESYANMQKKEGKDCLHEVQLGGKRQFLGSLTHVLPCLSHLQR